MSCICDTYVLHMYCMYYICITYVRITFVSHVLHMYLQFQSIHIHFTGNNRSGPAKYIKKYQNIYSIHLFEPLEATYTPCPEGFFFSRAGEIR